MKKNSKHHLAVLFLFKMAGEFIMGKKKINIQQFKKYVKYFN